MKWVLSCRSVWPVWWHSQWTGRLQNAQHVHTVPAERSPPVLTASRTWTHTCKSEHGLILVSQNMDSTCELKHGLILLSQNMDSCM